MGIDKGSSKEENKQSSKIKKLLVGLLLVVILIVSIKAIKDYNSRKSFEKSRIAYSKEVASEYNLNDATVILNYKDRYNRIRSYNLTVESLDFEKLGDSDKLEFINKLDVFVLTEMVDIQVISNDNVYERHYLYENVLEKNGKEYYVKNANQKQESSTSTYNSEPSEDDKSFAWAAAKREVKGILKAPSTAKFPFSYLNEDIEEVDINTFVVESYVDAENSFGAKIRVDFMVKLERTGENTYNVLDIQLYE